MSGYEGIGPEKGIYVKKEDAFSYALERLAQGTSQEWEAFKKAFEDWYYSDNWIEIKEESHERNYER